MESKEEEVQVELLRENSFNPNEMSAEKLATLKASMQKDGQQQPVIIRKIEGVWKNEEHPNHSSGSSKTLFEIIDGAHRTRIAKELKWKTVKAIVQDVDEATAMRLCYKINDSRGTLDFFKQAKFFQTALIAGQKAGALSKEYGVSDKFIKERQQLSSITQEEYEGILQVAKKNKQDEPDSAEWLVFASLNGEERKEAIAVGKGEHYGVNFNYMCRRGKEIVDEKKKLAAAMEKAAFKTCPICKGAATGIAYGGNLECAKDHDWNPKTGKIPQTGLESDAPKKTEKKAKTFQRTYKVEGDYAAARAVLFDVFDLPIELDITSIRFDQEDKNFAGELRFGHVDEMADIHIEINGKHATAKLFEDFFSWDIQFRKEGNTVVPMGTLDKSSDATIRKVIDFLGLKVIEKKKKEPTVSVGHVKPKVKKSAEGKKTLDEKIEDATDPAVKEALIRLKKSVAADKEHDLEEKRKLLESQSVEQLQSLAEKVGADFWVDKVTKKNKTAFIKEVLRLEQMGVLKGKVVIPVFR